MAAELPGSPKEIVTELSLAVQAALEDSRRRLEVSVPDGLGFGVFGPPPGRQALGDPDNTVPAAQRALADAELAFLTAEVFQNLGDGVACVFPGKEARAAAKKRWERDGRLQTRLLASAAEVGGRGASGFGGKRSGGSASAAAPRVVLLVRATSADLKALQPFVDPLGDEVLVILVNPARLKSGAGRKGYTAAFVLRDNPHPDWRGGLLYRRYPEQWALGVGAARGRAVVHGRSEDRPTLGEIDTAFDKIKSDTGLISQAGGLLSAAGAAAALERRFEKEATSEAA